MRLRKKPEKKLRKIRLLLVIVIIAGLGGGVWYYLYQKKSVPANTSNEVVVRQNIPEPPASKGTLKIFTGQQFKDLYNNFAYPNTEYISDNTPITGNPDADKHIRTLAEKRGYVKRSAPISDNFKSAEEDNMVLQERAAEPWLQLKAAAKKDGLNFGLTAAYRSAAEQTGIFVSRLGTINLNLVTGGAYDNRIINVLSSTALPGYSRHHTGYTIDIACKDQPNAAFEFTTCFKWLSADNYKNAKTFGWIPSYPEGADEQGPEPESWEYVWVGTDTLTD